MTRHRTSLLLKRLTAALALATAMAPGVASAAYPDKPITMVIPFGAGGITDLVGRATAQALSQELGQSIIIENRPGAGGNIAAAHVKGATPDGYTIMFAPQGVFAVNPHTSAGVNFDSFKDFTYISKVASTPHVIVVNPGVKASTLDEAVALAKQRAESVSFGTAGIGSSPFQGMEIMQQAADVKFLHVPYKSGAESVTNVVGAQVDMTFEATPVVMPFVESGRLKALAVANPERIDSAPDVPSTAELGYPGIVSGSIAGLVGPAGLPENVVKRLNEAIRAALEDQQFKDVLTRQGTQTASSTPEEFRQTVQSEYDKWKAILKPAQ